MLLSISLYLVVGNFVSRVDFDTDGYISVIFLFFNFLNQISRRICVSSVPYLVCATVLPISRAFVDLWDAPCSVLRSCVGGGARWRLWSRQKATAWVAKPGGGAFIIDEH